MSFKLYSMPSILDPVMLHWLLFTFVCVGCMEIRSVCTVRSIIVYALRETSSFSLVYKFERPICVCNIESALPGANS